MQGAFGTSGKSKSYCPKGASRQALDDACEIFGVTLYQLGKLLGVTQISVMYAWRTTKSYGKEMGQKYSMRLNRLYSLHARGVNLAELDEYDWDTDEVAIYEVKRGQKTKYIPRAKRRIVPNGESAA